MIKIGTRGSPLALIQANLVKDALSAIGQASELVIIKTTGDINTKTPLADIGGKALFAKEIQSALLNDTIDIGVHSLKDLEVDHPQGLELLATLKREDTYDLLFYKKDFNPYQDAFTLGTCSPRRAFFAKNLFKNVQIHPLRGNVQTRIEKIQNEDLDATILAVAGLKRLGLYGTILKTYNTILLPQNDFPPASCQGIIGIEGKPHLKTLLAPLNDPDSFAMAHIERSIIKKFNGNCHSAIGILTTLQADKAHVRVAFEDPKTKEFKTFEDYANFV